MCKINLTNISLLIIDVLMCWCVCTDYVDRFPDGDLPRWNFTDFMHSFMIVFRVLCGEWIESMWDCMLVGDVSCIPFFLATVVIGNLVVCISKKNIATLSFINKLPKQIIFQVLNLFLALLLSNFGSSSLSTPTADQDTNKIAEAFNRISRFIDWVKRNVADVMKLLKNKLTNQIAIHAPGKMCVLPVCCGMSLYLYVFCIVDKYVYSLYCPRFCIKYILILESPKLLQLIS